ncbi:MAG: transglycosylase SLT domain-containing protein [Gemmatimonadota bacterium]
MIRLLLPLVLGVAQTSPAASGAADAAGAAIRSMAAGLPLRAAGDLARWLSTGAPDDPALLLLAARANGQARAWPAVRRLLVNRAWLDSLEAGRGRALLGTAYLALDSLDASLSEFEALFAARGAPDAAVETDWWVPARLSYARALSRSGRGSEAARVLLRTVADVPRAARWLELSAMQRLGEAGDTAAVRPVADRLARDPIVPRDSVRRTVAIAFMRAGDPAAGLAAAAGLSRGAFGEIAGRWVAPARLATGDSAGAVAALLTGLESGEPWPAAAPLLVAITSDWRALRAAGLSDLRAGRGRRASGWLRRALEAAPDTARPRLALAAARGAFEAGEYEDALEILRPWLRADGASPRSAAGVTSSMWFLAGRARYRRGERQRAAAAWRRVLSAPGSPDGAQASFLLADMAHDAGDFDAARDGYVRTVQSFPRSAFGGLSLMRLGMLEILRERPERARSAFDGYRRRYPSGSWSLAATFWAARAREALGDTASAAVLYRQTLGADPLGYYGIRSARSLGRDAWEELKLRRERVPDLSSAQRELLDRMDLLASLGWADRGRAELDAFRRRQRFSTGSLLALAGALDARGWTKEGTAIAWSVLRLRGGRWSESLLRAVYPLPYRPQLEAAGERAVLAPSLLASLVRRESAFDASVVSSAGAVGLAQIIPRTAFEIARRTGLPEFDEVQLGVPEINLLLGGQYLRDLLDRFGASITAALAAYNAGPHRLVRWRRLPEFRADEELFVDRIPFSETRRYVKAVLAHAYVYRRLYALDGPGSPPGRPFPAAAPARQGS